MVLLLTARVDDLTEVHPVREIRKALSPWVESEALGKLPLLLPHGTDVTKWGGRKGGWSQGVSGLQGSPRERWRN